MTQPTTDTDPGCALCDLPVDGVDIVDPAGNQFCCEGCKDVHEALGDVDDVGVDDVRRARESADGTPSPAETPPPTHERTFFEVEGMHCATCEAFIESLATNREAVSGAWASYTTDTVRIDHDPERIPVEDLRESISGLGYSAYLRDDAFNQRRANDWAFARLAAGLLVGMMVMFQYVVVIYPTYFDGLFYDERTAQFLTDAMAATSGQYFFVVVGVLTSIVLFFTGKPILQGAYVSILTRSPNMDLLVALAAVSAYLYSTLTIVTGGTHIYYDVTVAIIVVVTLGNYHESTIKERATDLLSDLTTVQVDTARRLVEEPMGADPESEGGGIEHEEVGVDALTPGDHVLVREGERVPIDGRVIDGEAAVDEAIVTGESLPVLKTDDDRVVGGSIVTDGALVVAVGDNPTSSLDRIANLVWDLQSSASGIQKLADKLATIFVPGVLILAIVVTSAYLLLGATITAALLVGLTVLIVSCPCALGLATPLAVATGLREALERNVVVFDDTVFERLREVDTVVFDKTGTLTSGELEVVETDLSGELLDLAAELESRSAHPVATAISGAFGAATDGGTTGTSRGDVITATSGGIETFETYSNGVAGVIDETEVVVGHPDLFVTLEWDLPDPVAERIQAARDDGHRPIVVGRDGDAEGVIVLRDRLREEWEDTVRALDERGIDVVVLTGDDPEAAEQFRRHEGIDRVFAGVPPEGKAETIDRLASQGQTVMVGDGTNDAPALARADLGIAIGGGTAMAVDAADVAIVDDDLRSVATVFDLATAAGRRVKENIGWAFCYNAIAIPLAVTGLLNPLFAAVAMATSSVLVVTNSSRSLRTE